MCMRSIINESTQFKPKGIKLDNEGRGLLTFKRSRFSSSSFLPISGADRKYFSLFFYCTFHFGSYAFFRPDIGTFLRNGPPFGKNGSLCGRGNSYVSSRGRRVGTFRFHHFAISMWKMFFPFTENPIIVCLEERKRSPTLPTASMDRFD